MDFSILILVAAVAAVAYFYWNRRKGSAPGDERKAAPGAPVNTPAAASGPATAAAPGADAAPARAMATAGGAGSPAASYDEYRRVSPSNMVYGKLTCNRCGSNLIRVEGGAAACMSCGASLYRA
jgi:hypothetical protein